MAVLARARRFLATPLTARLEGAVRDAKALLGTRSGGPRVTAGSRVSTSERSGLREGVELTLAELVRETPDAVTLVFADGHGLTWKAGQFLTLVVPVGPLTAMAGATGSLGPTRTGPLKRAYSVSSAPGGPLQVTVKRVSGGRASSWLVERAEPGQRFVAHGPSGSFLCEPEPDAERRILLVGAGSGVTPLIAIAEDLRKREPRSVVRLVYGNRSPRDAIFLSRLKGIAGLGLSLVFEVPDELDELGSEPGRLDLERLGRELGPEAWDAVYTCGPRPVMDAVRELAVSRGWPTPQEERFESLAETKGRAATTPQALRVTASGRVTETTVRPGQTLLEAGLAAKVAMPFSCTMGGCGACRVRLVDGAVVHDEPNGLSADEVQAGYVFACVARPTSPCAVEVP